MDGAFSSKLFSAPEAGAKVLHTNFEDNSVHLPSGESFLRADFARSGPDLLIETPSGGHYVLPGYFMAEDIPSLETFDGAVLSPKLVSALAGPQAAGMVAQAAAPGQAAAGSGASIGQVSEVAGGVTVRHVDGSQGTLAVGAPVFQGDVLETGPASHVGIIFVDDTVFSLDESGRMVIDEMVFDPDAQSGVFNAQVVQGVFSFVSGQVAKTSPDGMVVETPTSTIGIRGSTVLGRAAAEGAENRITLAPDVDGNVGELTIFNGAGTQVLNQPGASTTIFSINAAPTPVVIMSPVEMQQNFGTTLTKLTQVLAQKATVDAARAQVKAQQAEEEATQAETEAQQAQDEAQQADEGAQEADAEAEAAQAEAEAAAAAAAAAKAEAEAKGDPEALALAAAAEVKAAEAQAKAQAAGEKAQVEGSKAETLKAAAEAKMADFATKATEVFQAQAQAQKAVEFTAVAKTAAEVQGKVFQEFVQSGLITLPPGMSVTDVMSAGQQFGAQMAAQAALASTVSPGDGPGGPGEGPEGGPGFGPDGGPPDGGFQGPGPQYGFQQQPFGMTAGFDPFGGFMDPFGGGFADPFGGGMMDPYGGAYMDPYGGGMMDPYGGGFVDPYGMGSIDLFNFFDPTDLYNLFVTYDPFDVVNYYYDETDTTPLTTVFDETLIAGTGGGVLSGGSGDTNYYFQWREDGSVDLWLHGDYIVADAGGTNQLSLDNLNNATVKVSMDEFSDTGGTVQMWDGLPSEITEGVDLTQATVTFSNINQFMLSDVSVASFATIDFTTTQDRAGDVMVLSTLDAGETGYVIAGTDGDDTFTINQTFDGAIIFGKGNDDNLGGDYFYFESTSAKDITVVGGADNSYDGITDVITDNHDDDGDGIPDSFLNVFDYTNMAGYSPGQNGIVARFGELVPIPVPDDVSVTDRTTYTDNVADNDLFNHQLWDVGVFYASQGDDRLYLINGSYYHVDGGNGNDTITSYQPGHFNYLYGGLGDDTITVNAAALEYNRVINGRVTINGADSGETDTGSNSLTIEATYGSTYCLTDPSQNGYVPIDYFDTVTFDAASATGAVTVYSTLGQVTFSGSSFDDTFQISSDQNILTGGSGADIYKYVSASGIGDSIEDFTTGIDKFTFNSPNFGNILDGALSSTNFFYGSGTQGDGNDYFVFDTDTHILYYDSDVTTAGGQTAIADLSNNSGDVQATDITIYGYLA
ncbi:MAG: FecR domain-containing protein [Rhodospirillales bacterium]|nr:FecR domain-containing protein [Rhodospirillales bacterium]